MCWKFSCAEEYKQNFDGQLFGKQSLERVTRLEDNVKMDLKNPNLEIGQEIDMYSVLILHMLLSLSITLKYADFWLAEGIF